MLKWPLLNLQLKVNFESLDFFQMLKRKAAVDDDKEDRHEQPRKRIRPLLQRDLSLEASQATSAVPETAANVPTTALPSQV